MIALNNKIVAYLTVNNISFTSSDYTTAQPDNEPDQIIYWNTEKLGEEPTEAQLDAAYPVLEGQKSASQNKDQAMKLLQETDWTQMPDVSLVNKNVFTAYRSELRAIALDPPVTVAEWPIKPEEVWS